MELNLRVALALATEGEVCEQWLQRIQMGLPLPLLPVQHTSSTSAFGGAVTKATGMCFFVPLLLTFMGEHRSSYLLQRHGRQLVHTGWEVWTGLPLHAAPQAKLPG